MGYTKDQLDKLATVMRGMPDASHTREHTKSEAVRILSKEISALQKRGYTLQQVGEILKTGGLEITTETLKNYLQRSKASSKSSAGGPESERTIRKAASEKKQVASVAKETEPGSGNGDVGISILNPDSQDMVKTTPLVAVMNGTDKTPVTPAYQLSTSSTRAPERMGMFVVGSDSSRI